MGLLNILILIGLGFLIPTAYAAKIGAPYAPTFAPAIRKAFDYIKLGSGDLLIDLGAGDGKVLIAAARRGARARGFELSPIMWVIIWLRTMRNPRIKVQLRNFYRQSLGDATVVFAFLMPQNMKRVREYLNRQYIPQGKYCLVYAFPIPDVTPLHVIKADKCSPLYIYDLKKLTKSTKPN